jgi:hypothetical protein
VGREKSPMNYLQVEALMVWFALWELNPWLKFRDIEAEFELDWPNPLKRPRIIGTYPHPAETHLSQLTSFED